jgi:hypothetical protein
MEDESQPTTAIRQSDWLVGHEAWNLFVRGFPELGFRRGNWGFYNFLRRYRHQLVQADAIRRARGKHWIAHRHRFHPVAFDCATGRTSRYSEHVG